MASFSMTGEIMGGGNMAELVQNIVFLNLQLFNVGVNATNYIFIFQKIKGRSHIA